MGLSSFTPRPANTYMSTYEGLTTKRRDKLDLQEEERDNLDYA